MNKYEASIIEDNGGGLYLFVFENGIDSKVRWGHWDYEYNPGQLSDDIKSLLDGTDPVTDWDGAEETAQEVYDGFNDDVPGWEVVAQVYDGQLHLFPSRMGAAAQIEFTKSL